MSSAVAACGAVLVSFVLNLLANRDLLPLLNARLRIRSILRRAWYVPPVLLAYRFAFFLGIITTVPGSTAGLQASLFSVLVWPALYVFVPDVIAARIRRRHGVKLESSASLRVLRRIDQLTFERLRKELVFQEATEVDEVWGDTENRAPILILFEDLKQRVIAYTYHFRPSASDSSYVFYGTVVGNDQTRRIEGLFRTIGAPATRRYLGQIRSGEYRPLRRDLPPSWLEDPQGARCIRGRGENTSRPTPGQLIRGSERPDGSVGHRYGDLLLARLLTADGT